MNARVFTPGGVESFERTGVAPAPLVMQTPTSSSGFYQGSLQTHTPRKWVDNTMGQRLLNVSRARKNFIVVY